MWSVVTEHIIQLLITERILDLIAKRHMQLRVFELLRAEEPEQYYAKLFLLFKHDFVFEVDYSDYCFQEAWIRQEVLFLDRLEVKHFFGVLYFGFHRIRFQKS